jgi:hypothetical protein
MFLERKQDLSIYYWLKDLMLPYPMIAVNDGYPATDLQLPSVTIETQDIKLLENELGNRHGLRERLWIIDVIGTSKAQRDEITSIVLNDIETGIPVYDYDMGFPPAVSPTQLGLLRPYDLDVRTVRIFPELTEKMYWRNAIRFLTIYNAI